jgi:hypothetical protein
MIHQTLLGVPYRAITARLAPQKAVREQVLYATISVAGDILAQGIKVQDHTDGRVTISTGANRLTGWPIARYRRTPH